MKLIPTISCSGSTSRFWQVSIELQLRTLRRNTAATALQVAETHGEGALMQDFDISIADKAVAQALEQNQQGKCTMIINGDGQFLQQRLLDAFCYGGADFDHCC